MLRTERRAGLNLGQHRAAFRKRAVGQTKRRLKRVSRHGGKVQPTDQL